MKKLLLVFGMLLIAGLNFSSQAQSRGQLIRKGDQAYKIQAFHTAINNYEEAMKSGATNDVEAVGRLADSYRHLNRLEDAARYYAIAIKLRKPPAEFFLQYGHTLKGLGRYDEAKTIYTEYGKTSPEGRHFVESCDFARNEQLAISGYSVTNELINSSASEFAPAFYNGKLVFASSKMDIKLNPSEWDGKVYNRLYISSIGRSGNLDSPYFLKNQVRSSNSEGPLAFSPDGRTVAFTRNNFVEGTRQIPSSGLQLNLFIAEFNNNGDWVNVRAFPFDGGEEYSTGYPAFSSDGKAIYFSSNRPGGFGGYDIYISRQSGNSWSAPENLGPIINTPGNEISPFMDASGNLFFASDYQFGLGGFDIFRIQQTENRWGQLFHLGNEINSSYDDYGLIMDPISNTGYLVSNRPGGRGFEDIYLVKNSSQNFTFSVTNAADGSPIPGAIVDFTGCGDAIYQTDIKGQYAFQIKQFSNCEVLIRKEGFQDYRFPLSNLENQQSRDFQIRLLGSRDLFYGSVVDNQTGTPLRDVRIQSTNQSTGATSEVLSDAAGYYSLAISPGNVYILRYVLNGFQEESRTIRTGSVVEPNALGTFRMRSITNGSLQEPQPNKPNTASPLPSGFSVQVASMSTPDASAFQKLSSLANLYIKPERGTYKIRLGVFNTRTQAEEIRNKARQMGYPESFVVQENGGVMENISNNNPSGTYMIQVSAMRDPRNFDESKVRSFGPVVERSKGAFTLKLISGFSTLEAARNTLPKVQAAGYKDAFIVTEVNGQLIKAK